MKLSFFIILFFCPFFALSQPDVVRGSVHSEDGEPIPAATIVIKRTGQSFAADSHGMFSIPGAMPTDILILSAVGYTTIEVNNNNDQGSLRIKLPRKVGELDDVLVQAYGTTTRRLSTGNISKVSGEDIARQPVSNPLAALQGRVPGLVIIQTSGVPGSAFKVEIRGKTILDASLSNNDPLFIIDGIPFAPGNDVLNNLTSAATIARNGSGGISPFNSINPADIESIEILKDADATAIYGSRGANGVIIITTKKGRSGKPSLTLGIYTAIQKPTRTMDMLNTEQYLAMRYRAYANDGITPTATDAPDLLVWDTSAYTDFKKLLTGGRALATNAQLSFAGGNEQLQYRVSGGYDRQTNVFPGSDAATRASFQFNLGHVSFNKKLRTNFVGNYSSNVNNLPAADPTGYINLPPNFPALFDELGRLKWEDGGEAYGNIGLSNPFAYLLKKYRQESDYLSGGFRLSYRIFAPLTFRAVVGYNITKANERLTEPNASLDPNMGVLGSLSIGQSTVSNWNIEPQLEYASQLGHGRINFLVGATLLESESANTAVRGEEYTNDELIRSLSGAGIIRASNAYVQYRYQALFARANYNWRDKYIVNLSARRDGSSRFGPDKRFSGFGAAGIAWIFSNEDFFKQNFSFVSFGKLRGSYGSTGNDRIGNYQYLDSWRASLLPYQGIPGLVPSRLYNPDYSWEINRKLEAAIELGFLNDRIFLSAAWYRNRSSNQLINYSLPAQTGFALVTKNLPALVENSGLELLLTTKNFTGTRLSWVSSFNISMAENKLVSFPGLATSNYASIYVEGESLSVVRKLKYTGVDRDNGIYTFEDVNRDGMLSNPGDYRVLGDLDPTFYGGWQNTFSYKNLELAVFLEFKKQKGTNYLNDLRFELPYSVPGFPRNQPVAVLNAWQQTGDVADVQKLSADPVSPAVAANYNLYTSDGVFSDASFIRCRNISLSYQLPANWIKRLRLQHSRVYCHAQNLFTITRYKGSDPETQNLFVLPPMKTIAFGIQVTL